MIMQLRKEVKLMFIFKQLVRLKCIQSQKWHCPSSLDISNENILLQAGKHIQMAKKQRHLYQTLELKAVTASKENVIHQHGTYTLVVEYGQNMEYSFYAAEQPGHYYMPLNVYVLGCANHTHEYSCDDAKAYMHAHVSWC